MATHRPARSPRPKVAPPMPEFSGRRKEQIVAELGKSPHGKLEVYRPLADAALDDPEFFSRLLTWNKFNGEVKDALAALPGIALSVLSDHELRENALAHMASLDPRLFVRALRFARTQKVSDKLLQRLVYRRLKDLEANEDKWTRTAVQHKASLHYLYRHYHVPRPEFVARNIFRQEGAEKLAPIPGTIFDAVQSLPRVTPVEAAGLILKFKIPFLAVRGALGKQATDPAIAHALIEAMSPTELIHNTKDLQKNYGLKSNAALRGVFEKKIAEAAQSKRGPSLKAGRAAEALEDVDQVLATKMQTLQEQRMERLSVEGNWLVLADKSGSMKESIETGKEIAAVLARAVKGSVHLVFFDVAPRYVNVTGKTLEEIKNDTRHVIANGGTAIGSGVKYAALHKLDVDGIVLISDGAEHSPPYFTAEYERLAALLGKQPPVYFYRVPGEEDSISRLCEVSGIPVHLFDLRTGKVDYYSLPNLVKSMKVQHYGLMDAIMGMPLLKLDEVLSRTQGMKVLHVPATAVVS